MSNYKVSYGESLSSIAKKKGVSVSALWDANKSRLSNPNSIRGGMTLWIPTASKANKVESAEFWTNLHKGTTPTPTPAATPAAAATPDPGPTAVTDTGTRNAPAPATTPAPAPGTPQYRGIPNYLPALQAGQRAEAAQQLREPPPTRTPGEFYSEAQGDRSQMSWVPPSSGPYTKALPTSSGMSGMEGPGLKMSGMEGRQNPLQAEREKQVGIQRYEEQLGTVSPFPIATMGGGGLAVPQLGKGTLSGEEWRQSQYRVLERFKDFDDIPGLPILAEARIIQLENMPDWAKSWGAMGQNIVASGDMILNWGFQASTRVEELIQTALFLGDLNYFKIVKETPWMLPDIQTPAMKEHPSMLGHAHAFLPSMQQMWDWRFRNVEDPEGMIDATWDFIHDEDGSLNWERIWGKPVNLFTTTVYEAAYSNMGIASLYPTYLTYPERQEKLINALIADENGTGKNLWEHLMDHESFFPELIAGIFLDITWWIPDEVIIAGRTIPKVNQALSAIIFPPAPFLGLGASYLQDIWKRSSVRGSTNKMWKKAQLAIFSDDLHDAASTLLAREIAELGDDFNTITFFEALFFNPDAATINKLPIAQRQLITNFVELLGEAGIETTEDLVRKGIDVGWFSDLGLLKRTPAGFTGRMQYVMSVITDEPISLLRPAVRMAEKQWAANMGLNIYPSGALYRTLTFAQSVLVENWLYNNLRYMSVNGLGDWMKAIIAGYRASPFDYNAGERVVRHLTGYDLVLPASIARLQAMDVVNQHGRLQTANLPWPIGDVEGGLNLVKFLSAMFGGDGTVPDVIQGVLDKGPLRDFLDVCNYSTILEGGRRLAWLGEQMRRVSILEQSFSRRMYTDGGTVARFANAVANDTDVPIEMFIWLQAGRLKSPQDFDDFIRIMKMALPVPSRLSVQIPSSLSTAGVLVEAVAKRLDDLDDMYVGIPTGDMYIRSLNGIFSEALAELDVTVIQETRRLQNLVSVPADDMYDGFIKQFAEIDQTIAETGNASAFIKTVQGVPVFEGATARAFIENTDSVAVFRTGSGTYYASTAVHDDIRQAIFANLPDTDMSRGLEIGIDKKNRMVVLLQATDQPRGSTEALRMSIEQEDDLLVRIYDGAKELLEMGIPGDFDVIIQKIGSIDLESRSFTLEWMASLDFLGVKNMRAAVEVPDSIRRGFKDLLYLSMEEAPITSAILEPSYVKRNLKQVIAGSLPENVVLRSVFEDLSPEAADALARSYLESGTGLSSFYQDALTAYNMKYGSNISEAFPMHSPTSRGGQTVMYSGEDGPVRNASLQELMEDFTSRTAQGEQVELYGVYDEVTGRLEWSDVDSQVLMNRMGVEAQDALQLRMVGPNEFMVIGTAGDAQQTAIGLKRLMGQGAPSDAIITYPLRGGRATIIEAAYYDELHQIQMRLSAEKITVEQAEVLKQQLFGDIMEGTSEVADPLTRRESLWKAIKSGEGDQERLISMLETRRSKVVRDYLTDEPFAFIDITECLQTQDYRHLPDDLSAQMMAGGEGYTALKATVNADGVLVWYARYHPANSLVPITIPLTAGGGGLVTITPSVDSTTLQVEQALRGLLEQGLPGSTQLHVVDWRQIAASGESVLDITLAEYLQRITSGVADSQAVKLTEDALAAYKDVIHRAPLERSQATERNVGVFIDRLDKAGDELIGVIDPNVMAIHYARMADLQAHGILEAAAGMDIGSGIRIKVDSIGTMTLWGGGLTEEMAHDFAQKLLGLGANPRAVVQCRWVDVASSGHYAEAVTDEILTQLGNRTQGIDIDVQKWTRAVSEWRSQQTQELLEKYNHTRQGLMEWKRNAQNLARTDRATLIRSEAELQAITDKVNEYKRLYMEMLANTLHKAEDDVQEVMFDYAVRSRPEQAMRGYSPFLTWQIRNPIFWADQFSQRPNLLNLTYSMNRKLETQRKQRNLTSRFEGTIGFETREDRLGFTPGYFGFKLTSLIDIFQQFQSPFEPPGFEAPSGARGHIYNLIKAGKWLTIRPWPYLDYLFQLAGIAPREGMGELFGPTQRFIEAWLRETGILPPEGRTETAQFLFYYNLRRRLSEMEAEGRCTHEESLKALAYQQGDAWDEASKWVIRTQNLMMVLSFFIPLTIKYASQGEMQIREDILNEISPEDAEYLRTYSLVMQNDPQAAMRELIYYQYDRLLEGLNPAGEEYKDLITARHLALKQAGIESTPTIGLKGLRGLSVFATMEELTSYEVYQALNEYKPRAEHYVVDGSVDWDAYHRDLEIFTNRVPGLTQSIGFPISAEDWQAHLDRHRSAIQIAYDVHKDEMSSAWKLFESIQPGGTSFLEHALEYVDEEVKAAFAGGMTLEESSAYGAKLWADVLASGLPRNVSDEILAPYVEARNADMYSARVRERIKNIDGEFRTAAYELAGFEFPGMFGEETSKGEIFEYYNSLLPYQQTQVKRILGMPETTYFTEWVTNMDDQGLDDLAARLRQGQRPEVGRNMIPDEARYGIALNPELNLWVPSPVNLTEEIQEELKQVKRDWFLYSQQREMGYTSSWTPLMEEYYGDPTSPKSQFWEILNSYVLSSLGMDDPIIGAVLDRLSRSTLDFEDDQYEAALNHFNNNLDLFVDWPATRERTQEHPDWVLRASEEMDELGLVKIDRLEDLRSEYYNINWRHRYRWEDSRKEEWDELKFYLMYLQAAELGQPYYLYLNKNWEYKNWYGVRPPDELGNLPEQLSERYFQAIWDYDSWHNGTGLWTDEMKAFIGPDPGAVDLVIETTTPSGGSTSSGPAPSPAPGPAPSPGEQPPTQPPWIGAP